MPGVVNTQAAWLEKHEVVEVVYDPKLTTLAELVAKAKGIRKFSKAWLGSEEDLAQAKKLLKDKAVPMSGKVRRAKDTDQLFYLRGSIFWKLGLEGPQAVRVNALLAKKADATQVLSPNQKVQLANLRKQAAKSKQGPKRK